MRIQNLLTASLALSSLLSLETVAAASSCSSWSKNSYGRQLSPSVSLVEYFTENDASPNDQRCTGHNCSLWGWLYLPDPNSNCPPGGQSSGISSTPPCYGLTRHPTVVFNEGHEYTPDEPCAIADFFTRNGMVLFVPQRRGTWDAADKKQNTGVFIDQCIIPNSKPGTDIDVPKNSLAEVTCLADQVKEVDAAIRYLSNHVSGADMSQLALMGHSFGGSLTLYAAAANLPVHPKAAIDISGAALGWDGNTWYQVLVPPGLPAAVIARKLPVFFLQPSNETSLEPTIQLSAWAGRSGDHMFEAGFFPPVLPEPGECPSINDSCSGAGKLVNKAIHSRFVNRAEHVNVWGPATVEFLHRNGVN